MQPEEETESERAERRSFQKRERVLMWVGEEKETTKNERETES